MASLKDTVVSGSLRATDTIYSTTNQFQILRIPTSSNGTTYGPGTNGQILKSNGTSVYWASDNNSDTNVTQAAAITTAGAYPIILANSTATSAVTGTVNKTSTLTYNPNTKSLVTGGTVDGYTLAAASAKAVTDSSSASAISTGTSLPTERDIYYGLPTINNAHNYTSSTNIYAPTGGGTAGQFLGAEGSTSTPTWKDLHYTDLKPTIKKTYTSTDYYATENSDAACCFYFMSVKPDSWYKPWTVKFKVHSFCPSYPAGDSVTYSTISGREQALIYQNWNELYNSAHYYTPVVLLKKAGFDAGLGHAIGISIRYGWNYTNSAYYRTFEVEYYECDGCTVTMLDTPVKLADWTNYSTTNYNGINNLNACSRGLQESGDADNTCISRLDYPRITTGSVGIGRYTLFMRTSDGTYQSITSTFNNTGTSHVKNTALFRPERVFYRDNGGDLAANNTADNGNSWAVQQYGLIDLRYSTNCGSTLQVRKPVYLVGTINDDGFFSLADTWYTQTEPTSDDGKVYIYLGMPYTQDNSSNASTQYRIAFEFNNPIYWYKDGAFRLYETIPPITRGGTGATSASGARTNLGLGSLATKSSLAASDIPNLSASKITSDTFDAARIPTLSITDKTSGTLTVTRGGTGATTAEGARTNLELGNAKIFKGTCSTAAATVAKVVKCDDFTTSDLVLGAAILVTFTATNSGTVGSLTMNVNGTGAKNIKKHYNASAPANLTAAGELQANNTYLFVYNGTYWVLMTADYNNTYNDSALYVFSGDGRAAETAANGGLGLQRYTLQMMTVNQKWSNIAKTNNSTATNSGETDTKVISSCSFLLNSPIVYQTTNTYVAPGNSGSVNGYTAYNFNMRYSTSGSPSFTIQQPVYLVGTPNNDAATFKLLSSNWWTQSLPTSNDGKIYILIGYAYSASNVYLLAYHPIYYHNGTNVVQYTPGIVGIANGGTGATTAANARTNLGLGSLATKSSLIASDIPDLSSTYLKLTGGTLTGILKFKNNSVTTLQAESSITDSDYFSTKVYSTQNNDIYTELSIAPLSSDSIHYATKLAISDGTNLTMARLYHSGNIIYSSTAPTDADVIGGLAEGMIWLQPI